ncbi:Kinesin- motor protein [Blastocladiella emersonii ATCC 22665]|nr:Kinesin- motor protein [Blastocladiella emersonii ATCC 22665]
MLRDPLTPRDRGAGPAGGGAKSASSSSSATANSNGEVNIQVFVRCRPQNQREISERAPAILRFSGARSRELEFVHADRGPRKYTFDQVFSPDASQELVYRDVVAPILREVLEGYNCTIFAYGQTGTGKSFTINGDVSEVDGRFSPNAGMIPRALYNLFETLELSGSEFTVKLSCIEIYNENLRDLLALGPNPPPIRLSTDRSGSVVLQFQEEASVQTAHEAMQRVQEASRRRQTAATDLNAASSRSHCIFTITVFMRETTDSGEELLKTGKLNLVDLAGSENVTRSGAENMQAREAGLINKSLLYLGRVINALVKRDSHIPYRESKLTRLLQESLGGRAKTCIIATVSPVSNNAEETQSTLDYAHRAKNIQNKPEANQRMNKKVLMSDFTHEIVKLKNELKAQREQNGVHLSVEAHEELLTQRDEARQAAEQAKLDLDLKNDEVTSERNRRQIADRNAESARTAFYTTRDQLVAAVEANHQLKARTRDDRTVLLAVSQREATLRSLIQDMLGTIGDADAAAARLHGTVEGARELAAGNNAEVRKFRGELEGELKSLAAKLHQFDAVQTNVGSVIQQQLDKFMADMETNHTSACAKYDDLESRLRSQLDALAARVGEHVGQKTPAELRALFDQVRDELVASAAAYRGEVESWSSAVRGDISSLRQQHAAWSDTLTTDLGFVFSALATHFGAHAESLAALETQVTQFRADTVAKLQAASEAARAAADRDVTETTAMSRTLVADIGRLVDAFVATRVGAIQAAAATTRGAVEGVEADVQSFGALAVAQVTALTAVTNEARDKAGAGHFAAECALDSGRSLITDFATAATAQVTAAETGAAAHATATGTSLATATAAVHQHVAQIEQSLAAHAAVAAEGLGAAASTVAAGVAAFKDASAKAKDGVTKDAQWWKHKTMVDNCKQLVTGFTQRTARLESAATKLVTKRLREADEIEVPAKRRFLGPAPELIPAPQSRAEILQVANVVNVEEDEDEVMQEVPPNETTTAPAGPADPLGILAAPLDLPAPAPVPSSPKPAARAMLLSDSAIAASASSSTTSIVSNLSTASLDDSADENVEPAVAVAPLPRGFNPGPPSLSTRGMLPLAADSTPRKLAALERANSLNASPASPQLAFAALGGVQSGLPAPGSPLPTSAGLSSRLPKPRPLSTSSLLGSKRSDSSTAGFE